MEFTHANVIACKVYIGTLCLHKSYIWVEFQTQQLCVLHMAERSQDVAFGSQLF